MNYHKYPFVARPTPNKHPDYNRLRAELSGFRTDNWSSLLEIGCGPGSYLISLAWFNPHKRFLGVDSDKEAIRTAINTASDLGLKNIEFKPVKFENIQVDEKYDAAIAYGVYSWIPENSRRLLLRTFEDCLTESGFAILNHNLYPGWKSRSELAETLRENCKTPNEARERLTLIGESSVHGLKLAEEARNVLTEASDSFIVHELLNPDADCCSSSDFREAAALAGFETLDPVTDIGIKAVPPLNRITERSIRNIILLRTRNPSTEENLLESGWFTTKFVPAEEVENPALFYSPVGEEIRFEAEPAAVLKLLASSWPASIPCSELLKIAEKNVIKSMVAGEAIEYFSSELPVSADLNKPFCSPLTVNPEVFPGVSVNCRFEFVKLNEPMEQFLKLCDGQNSLTEIREKSGMSETECLDAIQIFQEMALIINKG